MKPLRLLVRSALVAGAVGVVGFVPWPHRVEAPAWIAAEGALSVHVAEPGSLVTAVREGETVVAGANLAVLKSDKVELEIEELVGKVATQSLRVQNLARRQQANDPQAIADLPTAREALADFENRLRRRQEDRGRLTLLAPRGGTVLAPPRQPERKDDAELAAWSGTPLDERNRGAYLEKGTQLCQIGDPQRIEAFVLVDQADVDFVRAGQRVKLRIHQLAQQFLEGEITEISELDLDVVPRELLGEKQLATRTDSTGKVRPLAATYQARVRLDEHAAALGIGATGQAKVDVEKQTLARLLYRYLRRTLRLEL